MKLKLVSPSEPVPPAAAESTGEPRYWAFLSYSHHDKAIAKRLQKQLETYRVPKRLVGRETSHGVVPPRLSPVFRDRDELHAGADLKASVQEALSRSRWLIVVCTPDSARSPWVNREIIEFKKLHGERRVLALIARGEPFASDMPGREAEECLAPALRRALTAEGKAEGEALEPIAADMRKHGDGPHRAMLKLAAGMLGVPFDDLARRDLQRRVRWLSALASASVVGVVVFAFLAVLALQARNEAQYQRQQAEGLIEFMLGDLRKKLEPVGRLEVLDAVGEKALAYYGGQDAGKLDATALGHRSRAMHLIGEIRDLRGQPAEALRAFEQAAATTAQLLAKSPQDGQRIFDHAQSTYWVGYAAWAGADSVAAARWWGEYLQLSERLIEIDASNVDWQIEVAFAHMNLGVLLLGTGRPTEALSSHLLARERFTRFVATRPELRLELANLYGWLAATRAQLGDYEGALVEQQARQGELRSALAADSKNWHAQRGLLQSMTAISQYKLATGNLGAAELASRQGLQIGDALLHADPRNAFWRSDVCIAHLRRVEILLALDRRSESKAALASAERCSDELDALGTQGPSVSIQIRSRLMAFASTLSGSALDDGSVAQAIGFIDQSIPLLGSNSFNRTGLSVDLANLALAVATHGKDQRREGEILRRIEVLLSSHSQTRDGAVLTPLAWAKYRLGQKSEASALIRRVQGTSYRHPAYVGLVNQLRAEQGGGRSHASSGEKE